MAKVAASGSIAKIDIRVELTDTQQRREMQQKKARDSGAKSCEKRKRVIERSDERRGEWTSNRDARHGLIGLELLFFRGRAERQTEIRNDDRREKRKEDDAPKLRCELDVLDSAVRVDHGLRTGTTLAHFQRNGLGRSKAAARMSGPAFVQSKTHESRQKWLRRRLQYAR